MFAVAAAAVLVSLALVLVRVILGPSVYDRLLAANAVGTLAILTLAIVGFLTGRPDFLDLAITYALLNMISTIAVLKFFRFGSLGDPEDADPPEA